MISTSPPPHRRPNGVEGILRLIVASQVLRVLAITCVHCESAPIRAQLGASSRHLPSKSSRHKLVFALAAARNVVCKSL